MGVDEAGRGTWAGPIVAAAVAVPARWKFPPEVTDSKSFGSSKAGRAQIAAIYEQFKNHDQIAIGIGIIASSEIDKMGIDKAQAIAQANAIRGTFDRLTYPPLVLVDGVNPPTIDSTDVERVICVPKGDALIPAIGLASIVAKAIQLNMMRTFDTEYPAYNFSVHAGYGTKAHQATLKQHGPCPIHRQSFRPIRIANEARKAPNGKTDLDTLLEELMDD